MLIINNISALFLILAALAQFIPPDKIKYIPFLGLGYFYILILNLAFVVFWIIFKRKYFLLSAICILLSWNNLMREYQFSPSSIPKNVEAINVMSFNVQNFNHQGHKNNLAILDSVIQLVNEQKVDIFCMQDFVYTENLSFNPIRKIKSACGFSRHYLEHYEGRRGRYGIVIFSKYPIVNHHYIKLSEDDRQIGIFADLKINKDTVRIYCLHLQSFHISGENVILENIMDNNSSDKKDKLKKQTKRIMGKMQIAYEKRTQEARILNLHIKKSPHPIILCGDFNDTPNSYVYNKIKGNLKDAFIKSGKSFGRTFLFNQYNIRIDYIFASENYKLYDYQVLRKGLSDHCGICCKMLIF